MTDFSAALRQIGGEAGLAKERLARAAKAAGISNSRAFDIWYGKARRIEPHEKTAILAALVQQRIVSERNELHALKIGLARLETRLSQTQAALARAQADGDCAAIEAVFGLVS